MATIKDITLPAHPQKDRLRYDLWPKCDFCDKPSIGRYVVERYAGIVNGVGRVDSGQELCFCGDHQCVAADIHNGQELIQQGIAADALLRNKVARYDKHPTMVRLSIGEMKPGGDYYPCEILCVPEWADIPGDIRAFIEHIGGEPDKPLTAELLQAYADNNWFQYYANEGGWDYVALGYMLADWLEIARGYSRGEQHDYCLETHEFTGGYFGRYNIATGENPSKSDTERASESRLSSLRTLAGVVAKQIKHEEAK